MDPVNVVQQRNWETAAAINEQAFRDSQSPYAGKFIGLANGQVVVVSDSLGDMAQHLRQLEPDPQRPATRCED